jgi:predicted MFS family arabinose efflux permease
LYFFGSVISDFGTWLQNCAQVLLAYQLAHSVFTVGLVTCAQFTSPLLLGPWAAVATNRFGGRRTLLATQLISAAVAVSLAVLDLNGSLNTQALVSCAIIGGLAYTFALPARNVTVQRLVPADKLKPAYAMDTVSYNLGRALAPVLIMLLDLAGAGFAWAFLANAVSFGIFSVILWRIDMRAVPEPERRSRVKEGFKFAVEDSHILVLLLMVAAVTIADDPILVLGPALAKQLHASPVWSGWFIAALGAGTVLGSFRRSKRQPSIRLAAFAVASLALCMMIFVFAHCMWLSCAAALGAGVSCLVANSVTRAALAAWAGSKPIASLLDGTLGSAIGPQWTGLALAVPALIPVTVIVLLPKAYSWLAALRMSTSEHDFAYETQ